MDPAGYTQDSCCRRILKADYYVFKAKDHCLNSCGAYLFSRVQCPWPVNCQFYALYVETQALELILNDLLPSLWVEKNKHCSSFK